MSFCGHFKSCPRGLACKDCVLNMFLEIQEAVFGHLSQKTEADAHISPILFVIRYYGLDLGCPPRESSARGQTSQGKHHLRRPDQRFTSVLSGQQAQTRTASGFHLTTVSSVWTGSDHLGLRAACAWAADSRGSPRPHLWNGNSDWPKLMGLL